MTNLSLHFTETTLTLPALFRSSKKTSHDLATSLRGTMHKRLYLAWPMWWLQKCFYRNYWSHVEIFTACFDLFCLIFSLCPQPRLWTESGQFHVRFALHRWRPSFFYAKVIPDEFFMQGSGQLPFEFPWQPGLNHVPWSLVFQKHGKNSAAF